MCGIVGYWGKQKNPLELASRMASKISHRGPDAHGLWVDEKIGLSLAHQRLSVIDLSPAGAQPMISHDNRYVITYNGEIYNHRTIRKEIEKHRTLRWHGESDTETLVEAISTWGVQETLQKCNGMFAFAVWDRYLNKLFLARDRIGEKPLYWGKIDNDFIFASEVNCLKAHPSWTGEINRNVLSLYMRHNYVPAPYSIYTGIFKLPPAHWLEVHYDGRHSDPIPYWTLENTIIQGKTHPFINGPEAAVRQFENLLADAVELRMMSDVPLGAFLSGGYDSSAIVALMQSLSPSPIKTFSIGFEEKDYNEAKYAKEVATHLKTEHTELYVSQNDLLDIVPSLSSIWDEPFSDSSQIPTVLLSSLTAKHVTVALSGDGGDELLLGYDRYRTADFLWKLVNTIPLSLQHSIRRAILSNQVPIATLLPWRKLGDRIGKASRILGIPNRQQFYKNLISHFDHNSNIVLGANEIDSSQPEKNEIEKLMNFFDCMMYEDQRSYLPDDILVKVDRATMRFGLEARVPLLDHRVVEFAWSLPNNLKFSNGQQKWILRQVVHKYIPERMMNRPKMGFRSPIGSWIRGPLRDWAEHLIFNTGMKNDGYLDAVKIKNIWDEHISGKRRWHAQLWNVLMFQSWISHQKEK